MTTAGWFGAIPERWDAVPLYGIASERKIPNKGLLETNLLSLSYGRIVRKDIGTNEGLLPASFETYQIVRPDDVVLRMTDLQNDQRSLRSALVGEAGIITSAYLALALRNVDPRFMAYQFRAIDLMKVFYSMGGGLRQSIGFGDLKRLPVLTPPLEEQRAIADYLDRETAQIDAFIAKNEELITLLTERRIAVIELAIREGAGATAKLGVLLRGLKDGTHGSFARIESPHPLLGARNVQGGRLVLDGKESTISEDDHCAIVANGFPRRGDVLLVIVGATIGKSAVYELTDSLSFQRSVAFLRPGRLLTSKFLWYYTQTRAFQDEVWLRAKVSAQPGLYLGDVASIPIALPDVAAQQAITARLDRDVVAIDEAISVARIAIELARERRTALISAAVTGKIDVGVAV